MIPKSFNLGGHKFKIKRHNNNSMDEMLVLGKCKYLENEILIKTHVDGSPLTETIQEHTFWHEVVHAILTTMNENVLNDNEQFVDNFAGHLHQVVKSMR